MRWIFLILTTVRLVAPALADDRPLTRPSRDVAVEYHSSSGLQGPSGDANRVVTMRFASKTGRIRIEGSAGHGYTILDLNAGRMTMVMPDRQIYMEQPAEPGMLAMYNATNGVFSKSGTETVAGVSCTVYDARINERKGQLCLTDDGVLLRARSEDPERPRQLEAQKVTYGDQPASLFDTPAGYQKLDPAAMAHGMNLPPGAVPPGAGARGGLPAPPGR